MWSQSVTFRVETPLFCSGVDANAPQWRIPSMKGGLRYWYRAIQPDLKKEKDVYGSTQRQSPIRLHQSNQQVEMRRDCRGFPRYFTFFLKGRSYVTAGSSFTMKIVLLPKREEIWKDFCASLWLMTTIGGLGARSRRGFGSLSVQLDDEAVSEFPFFRTVHSLDGWVKQVQAGCHTLWKRYPRAEQPATHPIVDPSMQLFVSSVTSQHWQQAMQQGAEVLQSYRKAFAKQRELLPFMGAVEKKGRFPSATWLRVVKIQGGYVPVYFVLRNDLPQADFHRFVESWGGWLTKNQFTQKEIGG